jgi:hypothetical protein
MFEGPDGKALMISQKYVPETCTLPDESAGQRIFDAIQANLDPCASCTMDREVCKGRRFISQDERDRTFTSRNWPGPVPQQPMEPRLRDAPNPSNYPTIFRVIGLDLGQSADYSAAAVLERVDYNDPKHTGPIDTRLKCMMLYRWPLNTKYLAVAREVLQMPADFLVMDYGGVGRAVVEMLYQEAMLRNWRGAIKPVQFTASNAMASAKHETHGRYYTVPKVDIIGALTVLVEQGGIEFATDNEGRIDPNMELLLEELSTFKKTITKNAMIQFGALPTVGAHDDLVCALGLACWQMVGYGYRQLNIFRGEPAEQPISDGQMLRGSSWGGGF